MSKIPLCGFCNRFYAQCRLGCQGRVQRKRWAEQRKMYDFQRAGSTYFNEDPMTDRDDFTPNGSLPRRISASDAFGAKPISQFTDDEIAKEHERRQSRKLALAKEAFIAFKTHVDTSSQLAFDENRDGPGWICVADAVLGAAAKRPF